MNYDDFLHNRYHRIAAQDGALAETIDEMEWCTVIDTLVSYGYDVANHIYMITGLDPESFDYDPQVMAMEALKDPDNKMQEIKDILFQHELDELQSLDRDY